MKNELQTIRLFSPLFPNIYRKNEWGDYEFEPEALGASDILEYKAAILDRIEKEKLPSEGERGLAVYLDDTLSQKVYSINPSVKEWNGDLWGVTEVQTRGALSSSELANLTDWLSGQFSDGYVPKNNMRRSRPKSWLIPTLMALSTSHTILQIP